MNKELHETILEIVNGEGNLQQKMKKLKLIKKKLKLLLQKNWLKY
jgi:hypothetical protein